MESKNYTAEKLLLSISIFASTIAVIFYLSLPFAAIGETSEGSIVGEYSALINNADLKSLVYVATVAISVQVLSIILTITAMLILRQGKPTKIPGITLMLYLISVLGGAITSLAFSADNGYEFSALMMNTSITTIAIILQFIVKKKLAPPKKKPVLSNQASTTNPEAIAFGSPAPGVNAFGQPAQPTNNSTLNATTSFPKGTSAIKTDNEKILLEKFRKILKMTQRVKKSEVAQGLGITESELFQKLIGWSDLLPFKIDDEMIIVDDISAFTEALDQQFNDWGNKEASKDGKIE
jgi:hypothetical protein